MAKGVNKVILVGNLGKDPEVRYMPSGGAVANLTIATTDQWKDKQSGEKQERTEWHNVVFYNRLAEIAGEYLRKGSQVYVEGSLRTRKWQDKDGRDRYTTEINATELQMLGSRGGGSAGFDGGQQSAPAQSRPQSQPQQQSQPQGQQQQSQPQGQQQQSQPQGQSQGNDFGGGFDDFDDDIPF